MTTTDKLSSRDQTGPAVSIAIGVPVEIDYTNHRGERCVRNVIPTGRLLPGDPQFHPHASWVIEAFDPEKGTLRTFDPAHLHRWGEATRAPSRAPEVTPAMVRQIADDPRVLAVYAALEFDELSDDGQAWTMALVEVAFGVARSHIERHIPGSLVDFARSMANWTGANVTMHERDQDQWPVVIEEVRAEIDGLWDAVDGYMRHTGFTEDAARRRVLCRTTKIARMMLGIADLCGWTESLASSRGRA